MLGNLIKAAKHLFIDEGSTTIPKGSTQRCGNGRLLLKDEDIVLKTHIDKSVIL